MTGVTLGPMKAFLAAVLTGLLAAAVAAPALAGAATSPGVHVDPGSPAGKQYQIPISTARGETAGRSSGSKSGTAPTFGSGITSAPSSSSSTSTSSSPTAATAAPATRASAPHRRAARRKAHAVAHGKRSASSHAKRNAPTPAVTLTNRASRNATTQANQVGSSSWLPLAAGGALVLLIGCGGGLALKRRM
jgi:hypothetical protein